MKKRNFWTQEQIDTVVKLYPDMKTQDIADIIGRTKSSVYSLAYNLKLHKSEDFIKRMLLIEADKLRILGRQHQFKKGIVPQNKGKKMSSETYEKCKVSFFKKGHKPHNTKYDGYEIKTQDGYKMVRVSVNKFVLLHRKIWTEKHGPILKGHIIIFKDGNSNNCDISNLEMISMKKNVIRNQTHHYPEELKQTIKLKNQLLKQINAKK
jgi:hypothetical protein